MMKNILDTVAYLLGYGVIVIVCMVLFIILYIKTQDLIDDISYKIWKRKQDKKKESEE